jgi:hypothetical protein
MRTIVGTITKAHRFPYNLSGTEFMRPKGKKNEENGEDSESMESASPWIPWVSTVFRLEYPSPTVMVTFGGIHFNFFSLGKQDSTMAISAHKNRSWHGREQVRHIFIFKPTTNLVETATTPWDWRGRLAVDYSIDGSIFGSVFGSIDLINTVYESAKAMPFLFVIDNDVPICCCRQWYHGTVAVVDDVDDDDDRQWSSCWI